jgi:hypothetical protein
MRSLKTRSTSGSGVNATLGVFGDPIEFREVGGGDIALSWDVFRRQEMMPLQQIMHRIKNAMISLRAFMKIRGLQ